jgi:hypothetical protein
MLKASGIPRRTPLSEATTDRRSYINYLAAGLIV